MNDSMIQVKKKKERRKQKESLIKILGLKKRAQMQNYSLDLSRAPSASRATLLVNKTRKMGLDGLLDAGL